MRTLAFGDIHGCHQPLLALLNAIDPQPDDTLIFLGDMIDRGPDSKGVIDTIRALEKRCQVITILGNHEEMMLASLKYRDERRYWLKYGGDTTLQSFGGVGNDNDILFVPADYVSWLKGLKPYHETEQFIFCHATPLPHLEMDKQSSDSLRWRFIPNEVEAVHVSGKTIICGHSAQKSGKVLQRDGIICIDTFAHGGGNLTALQVDSMTVWQVPSVQLSEPSNYPVTTFAL